MPENLNLMEIIMMLITRIIMELLNPIMTTLNNNKCNSNNKWVITRDIRTKIMDNNNNNRITSTSSSKDKCKCRMEIKIKTKGDRNSRGKRKKLDFCLKLRGYLEIRKNDHKILILIIIVNLGEKKIYKYINII